MCLINNPKGVQKRENREKIGKFHIFKNYLFTSALWI